MSRCKHDRVKVYAMTVISGRKALCLDCGASCGSWKRGAPQWAKRAFKADNEAAKQRAEVPLIWPHDGEHQL